MSVGIYCTLTLTHARSICGNSERVREKKRRTSSFQSKFWRHHVADGNYADTHRTPLVRRRYSIVLYDAADSSAIRVAEYHAYTCDVTFRAEAPFRYNVQPHNVVSTQINKHKYVHILYILNIWTRVWRAQIIARICLSTHARAHGKSQSPKTRVRELARAE